MKRELQYLAVLNNRSNEQMQYLYNSCGDFFTLLELLAKMKDNNVVAVPSTPEEFHAILQLKLKEDENYDH